MTTIERMKQEREVEGLMEILQKGAIYSKLRAADALAEIGEPALPPLVEAITGDDPQLRWRSAIALSRMGSTAVDPLVDLFGLVDRDALVQVIWALAEIGDLRAVPPIMNVLRDDDAGCCQVMAGAALLKLNDGEGVALVKEVCEKNGEEFADLVSEAFSGN